MDPEHDCPIFLDDDRLSIMKLPTVRIDSGAKAAGLSAFILIGVYLYTLAPTVTLEDSGDFAAAAYTLGIPHPPGFPLLMMLGNLFAKLVPINAVAWRIGLVSAMAGATACMILGLIVWRITNNAIAAFFAPLAFGLSRWSWSQAVIIEAYALNLLFIAVLIYLVLLWRQQKEDKWLYGLVFVYGLSLTNHLMMLAIGPFLLVFVSLTDIKEISGLKKMARLMLCFCLGLTPYIYLPLAAASDPIKNWGDPSTLGRFIDHVTLAQYKDSSAVVVPLGSVWRALVFAAQDLWRQWFPALLLVLVPAFLAIKRHKGALLLLTVFFIPSFLFALNTSNIMIYNTYYYLPVYFCLAVVMGIGIHEMDRCLASNGTTNSSIGRGILMLVIAAMIIGTAWQNHAFSSKRDFFLTEDFGRRLLADLPGEALLVTVGDHYTFPAQYLQYVEGFRTDVVIMPAGNLVDKDDLTQAYKEGRNWGSLAAGKISAALKKHRVFVTQDLGLGEGFSLTACDLYYEIRKDSAVTAGSPPSRVRRLIFRGKKDFDRFDIEPRRVQAVPYRIKSELSWSQGDTQAAYEQIKAGLTVDPYNDRLQNLLGLYFLNRGEIDEARLIFTRVVTQYPNDAFALKQLGLIDLRGNYLTGAEANLRLFLIFTPKDYDKDYFRDLTLTAEIVMNNRGPRAAAKLLERYLKNQDDNPQGTEARLMLTRLRANGR